MLSIICASRAFLKNQFRPLILDVTSDHCFAAFLKIPSTLYTFPGTIVNGVASDPLLSYMYLPFLTKPSVLRSHTLRIPTTTTYRIINHLMFIDTKICSN